MSPDRYAVSFFTYAKCPPISCLGCVVLRIPVNVTADSGNVTDIPVNVTDGRCCAI
jgi:hypothetical protein